MDFLRFLGGVPGGWGGWEGGPGGHFFGLCWKNNKNKKESISVPPFCWFLSRKWTQHGGQKSTKIWQDGFGRAPGVMFLGVKKRQQHRRLLRSIFCWIWEGFWGAGEGKNKVFAWEWCKFWHFRLLQHKLALELQKPSIFTSFWRSSWTPKSDMLAPRGQVGQ